MAKRLNILLLFGSLGLLSDFYFFGIKEIGAFTTSPPTTAKMHATSRERHSQNYNFKEPSQYGERLNATLKEKCNLNCARHKRSKQNQTSDLTDTSSVFNSTRIRKTKPTQKPDSVLKADKIQFSRKYNPGSESEDSGFIPVPGPYGKKLKKQNVQRKARFKDSPTDDLAVKESQTSPNILGNGNFEIIRGGIFSDQETNEIAGSRRMGRAYGINMQPTFIRNYFNPNQNFQFPSFYPARIQTPIHPLFFPRAAY